MQSSKQTLISYAYTQTFSLANRVASQARKLGGHVPIDMYPLTAYTLLKRNAATHPTRKAGAERGSNTSAIVAGQQCKDMSPYRAQSSGAVTLGPSLS